MFGKFVHSKIFWRKFVRREFSLGDLSRVMSRKLSEVVNGRMVMSGGCPERNFLLEIRPEENFPWGICPGVMPREFPGMENSRMVMSGGVCPGEFSWTRLTQTNRQFLTSYAIGLANGQLS